jgi:transketolase
MLEARGIDCTIMIVASLNPAPVQEMAETLARFPVALTVEAHYVNGGVGSLVSEVVAEHGLGCRVVRCGVRTPPNGLSGSQEYFWKLHGLTRQALVETATRALYEATSRRRAA